ncbi:hypothetical protein [Pseudomonas coleopterorum]|uniref:Helix-turn-helix domain-containing protein n=1 Tax=Pseudomonas coleopterorum TaxID=1605838 RepID=A0AAJ6M4M9_9PSED|nr:hypothetical protein [Pseudomonas coleopterorum]WNC12087.1 hypothetical protein RI108_21880 [Pseudomonas coleopterorum]WNC12095.1 hypothetical protein RI108_21840 [Pseudomonas coleopterorum]
MRHTIDEAAALVGRTRRSLYRAMTEGRLAYGLEADGRRYIDTAELLRVFGAFKAASQDVTPEMSHGVTVPDDLGEIIAKAVAKAVAEAVEPLRKEIELLRLENAEQRRIEFKPDSDTPAAAPLEAPPVTQPATPASKPQSFADLLSQLD